MKVVVLAGGLSPERNVSLSSGVMVTEALRSKGYRVALVDLFFGLEAWGAAPEALYDAPIPAAWRQVQRAAPDLEGVKKSRKDQSASQFGPGVLGLCCAADAVFLALHGSCGEDGRVQAAFDLLGIPYTGSGHLGSAIAMDKNITKQLMGERGIQTPKWLMLDYTKMELEGLASNLPLPCVVKPLDGGSSIGVSIALDRPALEKALITGLDFGGHVIVEQYISGRELQVGVLEDAPLPSIEIIPKTGFYDYENKYQAGAAVEICPAEVAPEVEAKLRGAALRVHALLGLGVYSRSDFILDGEGTPWFLEINTLPGMTPTSLLPQEAQAVGIDYPALCERILLASIALRKTEK